MSHNPQLKEFLNSGKKIITDTKLPKVKTSKSVKEEVIEPKQEGDIHQVFVKRTIQDKPKKSEIIEDFKKFITLAEKEL